MKTATYRVKSPAKINLGLRIMPRRIDGFHNIQTIFYPVKLYDYLKIRITPSIKGNEINVKTISLPASVFIKEKDNICYKAANEFFHYFSPPEKGNYKVMINIRKKIPVGAGLGGGSSDAASVLKVLAKYFDIQKPENKLSKLALRLGSDVPFFLLGKPAYATSRGEILTPLPGFTIKQKILIVNPNMHISTKWAYEQLNIKYRTLDFKKPDRTSPGLIGDHFGDKEKFENDFEKVVFEKYPEIKRVKKEMYEYGAIFSSMSGSGSAVYGLFEGESIKTAGKFFKSKGYKVYYC